MNLLKMIVSEAERAKDIELHEATGPIPYEVMMDQIATSGKAGSELDSYEVFCLANLSWFFSSGRTSVNGQMDGIVNRTSNATSTEAVENIKALTKEQVAELADKLKMMVVIGDQESPSVITTASGKVNVNDWIHWVLKKQD